jgi:hypothetical protein
MKLENLPSESDGFKTYPVEFCGIASYLIIPAIDAKWDKTNLKFRSLIVRGSDFEVLSSGFPKFCNYGEKPDAYPDPEKFRDWTVTEKKDGSLLIADYVNSQFSMRTRGTVSYITQENAEDFEWLPILYPKLSEYISQNPEYSLLFEIMTPNNIIVLRSDEVAFTFLGGINKKDCSVIPQDKVDEIANICGLPQPDKHKFNNLTELVSIVSAWRGKEGVVVAYNNNQNRVKIKGEWYLVLHRIKSELSSENNLIEYYVKEGMPDYQKFYDTILNSFDFEIAEQLKGSISRMVDAAKNVKNIVSHMQEFVRGMAKFGSRKEQALAIIQSYGGEKNNKSGMCFKILDGKELSKDDYIKLMWQNLKN